MPNKEELYEAIIKSILEFDSEGLRNATLELLKLGVDPMTIIIEPITKALRIVGDKFASGEFFLMHMVSAAETAQKVIKEILEPEILKQKKEIKSLGKVVIGTVEGDIHDIGKNIVATMLFAAGFEVYDLGRDVPIQEFLNKAKEVGAQVVGASALLTTSMPMQAEIVKLFKAAGMRDKVKLIFGGAPVTEAWVKEIGGDGYAEDAVSAVKLVKRLLGINE